MEYLLRARDLSDRWGVSIHTLRQWRSRQIGPSYVKLTPNKSGHAYYPLSVVEKWENEKRVPSAVRKR